MLLLTLATTLPLDAVALPPVDVTACLVLGSCRTRVARFGDVGVAVVLDLDPLVAEATAVIGTSAGLAAFPVGHVASSTAHMSEDRSLERYDDAWIDGGTLAGGRPAAVLRIAWSDQAYREGSTPHGLDVVWRGPWRPHVDVVVCALDGAIACTRPVRVGGRPRVALLHGMLAIDGARYRIAPASP